MNNEPKVTVHNFLVQTDKSEEYAKELEKEIIEALVEAGCVVEKHGDILIVYGAVYVDFKSRRH